MDGGLAAQFEAFSVCGHQRSYRKVDGKNKYVGKVLEVNRYQRIATNTEIEEAVILG